jgi:hypothetical protein
VMSYNAVSVVTVFFTRREPDALCNLKLAESNFLCDDTHLPTGAPRVLR